MSILLPCACGKRLRVRDDLAGKRVRCPACSQPLDVPAPEVPVLIEEEVFEGELVEDAPPPAPPAPRPRREPPEEDRPRRRPAQARHAPRCWVRSDEILALSDDALYLTRLPEKRLRAAAAALGRGKPAAEVLEGAETVVPLNQVRKVQSNLHHAMLDVIWRAPKASEDTGTTIFCEDRQARDEVVAALRELLGPGWRKEVVEFNRLKASLAPLGVTAVFAFITVCFTLAAIHPDEGDGRTQVVRTNWLGVAFFAVFRFFGPVVTAVLGGLFVAAGLAWLVARLIKPPLMLTLTPRPAGRRRDS